MNIENTIPMPPRRLLNAEFIRYFVVSVMALAVDFGLLILFSQSVSYLIAASIAFCAGAVVNYALSVRFVFGLRRLKEQPKIEAAVFIAIGVIGLGANDFAMFVAVSLFSLSVAPAKLVAAGFSFVLNFIVRKLFLF